MRNEEVSMKKQRYQFAVCLVAAFVALCLFVLPGKAEAVTVESGVCGENLTWTLDDTGLLTISGEGAMSAWNSTGSNTPWYGKDVKAIVIGSKVTSVSDYAFYDCDSVIEITLGVSAQEDDGNDGVIDFDSLIGIITKPITIGNWAFAGCDNLAEVRIPTRVEQIGEAAFADCSSLNGIWVDAGHASYVNDSCGVLYSADMTKLIQAPGGVAYSYSVADSATTVGKYAFYGCTELTELMVGGSLKTVEENAFGRCDNLAAVHYTGTQAQWDLITIAAGNDRLKNAQKHCVFGYTGWISSVGKWYYYDDSVMVTGWRQVGGKWYYFEDSGVMVTNWHQVSGKWYYFNTSGAMHTGWLQLGSTWYYLEDSGAMVTGTLFVKGALCKFNASGAWQGYLSGWNQLGSIWYYTDNSGKPATGWKAIGGTYYFFNGSGVMQTGWLKSGNTWYYLKSSGAMATAWEQVSGKWYYFNASGAMLTGWQKIGNAWYYFNSSGAMLTGWQKIGSTWYYFQSGGAMQTGWLKLGSTWYYFHSSGAMATGSVKIGVKTYNFNASGACLNP